MMIPPPQGPLFRLSLLIGKFQRVTLRMSPSFLHIMQMGIAPIRPAMKTEQAALKSAQSREWRAAMEKELAVMDALGVFEWCFIPLGSNLLIPSGHFRHQVER